MFIGTQMNAGAAILTDCVFWFIIVPFLTIKDYNLNFVSIMTALSLLVNIYTFSSQTCIHVSPLEAYETFTTVKLIL